MKKLIVLLLLLNLFQDVSSQCGPTDFFSFGNFLGVPDELNRKRLKFDDMRYGNPYTLMDRDKFPNPNDGFDSIRKILSNPTNDDIRELYKTIYVFAKSAMPASGGNWSPSTSELPRWAKYNAFVFVIGLNKDFEFIDDLPGGNLIRDSFSIRALSALNNIDSRVPSAPFDGVYEPTNRLQKRCRELIMYCEAYDWLKAAAYDPTLKESRWPLAKGDGDRNISNCSPRNQLRSLARNFYAAAEGSIFGPIENSFTWKRNHGIMSASAIGMAAIVLNDAGVETNWFEYWAKVSNPVGWIWGAIDGIHRPAPKYSPRNWYELGEMCWENLTKGKHLSPFNDVPQTNADGSSGYAEGPGYFNYAMTCMLPYIRARNNFTKLSAERKGIITNLMKWQESIQTESGRMPLYDDTEPTAKSIIALAGIEGLHYTDFYVESGWEPDYIALMITPEESISETKLSLLDNSGNAVLKTTGFHDKNVHHYFHMLFESGYAVDTSEFPGGDVYLGHEHTDFGSFMIGVNNEWLAIDPPYMGYEVHEETNQFGHHNIARMITSYPPAYHKNKGSASKTFNNGFKVSMNQT